MRTSCFFADPVFVHVAVITEKKALNELTLIVDVFFMSITHHDSGLIQHQSKWLL